MAETSRGASQENPPPAQSPIIQVSSIYIELPFPPAPMNGEGCCGHNFSIRAFAVGKRGNNESISSLFPSVGGSNQDKELPPMEIRSSRYWHCSECNGNAIGNAGVQLNEEIHSDGTNLGILLGHSAETSESIRSIANNAKVQQGPIAQTTDIIQTVGTSARKLKVPTAHTTGSIRSIGTDGNENANTVDCSLVQSTQEIATAEAVETTCTGGQNEPTETRKDAVNEIFDEERNTETGQVITGGDTERPTEKESTDPGDFSISAHQNQLPVPPEKDKSASVGHTDIDETNSDSCQEIDNSNGHRKRKFRKLRLLYEILYGDDSKVKKADINSAIGSASAESAGSENVASEGQVVQGKDVANSVQSPRKRSKVNREDKETNDPSNGASNDKATKKDSGKPTTATNAHTSDAVVTPSSGGGIVNGPSTERERHGEGLVIGPNAELVRCSEGLIIGPNTERVKRDEGLAIGPNTERVRRGEGLVIGPNTERMRRGEGLVIGPNTERMRRGEGLVIGPNTERVRHSEGLVIGPNTERVKRRSDSTPSVRKKKNKHSKKLDVSVPVSSVKQLPVPSAAANLGVHPSLEQTDGNFPGLLSGAFKSQPSHSRSDKVGLDLSLGNFGKRKHNQDSGSQAFLKKDDILRESNARPTAEFGRSCSKGPSWDLNERATLMSSNLEKNKSPSQREAAFLQLDHREKSSDQPNQKESDQRADDIPMDIVELLAEKQYERRNSDTGKSPIVQQRTSDTSRKFFYGEMTGTVKHLIGGLPGLPSFPTASSENARTPLTLSQLSRKHLKLVQNEDTLKNMFTNLPQNQQKPSSGITISPAASGRDGLLYTGVEPLLSSTSSNPGFGLGLQQNQAAQHHKGRTISDIKQDELRKTEETQLNFAKPGGSGSGSKEPLDSYGNDSIPAMQLLSLMDGRSGTGFSLGSTKIHDKPFSPCGHHPRFSRGERQDFLNGSLFLRPVGTGSFRSNLSTSCQSSRPHSSSLSGHISFITPEKQILRGSSMMSGSRSGSGPSSVYDRDNQNPVLGGKKIIALPQRHQRGTDSSGTILEATSLSGRVRPERTASAEGVCRTNRNPADFSVPEPGNMYTICGKDLNPRKRKPYTKKNPGGGQAPAAKKQRNNSLGKASK